MRAAVDRVDRATGFLARRKALKEQRALFSRIANVSFVLMVLLTAATAARGGRVSEVLGTCAERSRPGWLTGALGPLGHAKSWFHWGGCIAQELSLSLLGAMLLVKLVAPYAVAGMARNRAATWQVDVLLLQGGVEAFLGAHLMHCLGGGWLPWLALWWAWCGLQVALYCAPLRSQWRHAAGAAALFATAAAAGYVPFHPTWYDLHASALLKYPWLGRASAPALFAAWLEGGSLGQHPAVPIAAALACGAVALRALAPFTPRLVTALPEAFLGVAGWMVQLLSSLALQVQQILMALFARRQPV